MEEEGEEAGVSITGREGGRRQRSSRELLQDLEASIGDERYIVIYGAT